MNKLGIVIILLIGLSTSLSAQTEKRIALVIGNSEYLYGGVLKNPKSDATQIANTLKTLDFDVTLLTDLNKSELNTAINNFKKKLVDYKVVFFYYAGHGIQIDNKNYIVPIDAKLTDKKLVSSEVVDMQNVINCFGASNDVLNIIVLDACRNDPFRSVSNDITRGFKVISTETISALTAFATGSGDRALDGGEYAKYLSEELNKDQSIEVVFGNTRNKIKTNSKGKQIPDFVSFTKIWKI